MNISKTVKGSQASFARLENLEQASQPYTYTLLFLGFKTKKYQIKWENYTYLVSRSRAWFWIPSMVLWALSILSPSMPITKLIKYRTQLICCQRNEITMLTTIFVKRWRTSQHAGFFSVHSIFIQQPFVGRVTFLFKANDQNGPHISRTSKKY